MKKVDVTDELLYKYMPLADEMELDVLEEEAAKEEFVLSEQFQRKMRRLIRKDKNKWVANAGRFLLKVAVVCLCILGVGMAITMSVDAYRSKFFQTVRELLEDSAVHTYDINEDESGFVPHIPTYMPEGYVEVSRVETENMISLGYLNGEQNEIYWDQIEISVGEQYVLDTEYIKTEYYKLENGYLVIFYCEENYKYAYYETEHYVYILSADEIEASEVKLIFQSIE